MAEKEMLSLESLNEKIGKLATELETVNTELEEVKSEFDSYKGEMEKKLASLKTDGGTAIVVNEPTIAPELSKKPYAVGKDEYLARYPRIQVGDKLYTSEELHEAPNKEILANLVKEFNKGENTFFEKVKS